MITAEKTKKMKALGFLTNRDKKSYSVRVVTGNGTISARDARVLADAAEKYGDGRMAFTSRLCVELQRIRPECVDALRQTLDEAGLLYGGTGPKVRPVVACKGTVCVFGLVDTQALASELHERFYVGLRGVKLPHKFKIAVGGCPNSCVKPSLNDVGIVGQNLVEYDLEKCRGCAKCGVQAACPMNAARVEDGKLHVDETICNRCGRCAGKCPFGVAKDGEHRYAITLGGRWGKSTRVGTPLPGAFTKEETVALVEKAIAFYRDNGLSGERFGDMIDRIGEQGVFAALL